MRNNYAELRDTLSQHDHIIITSQGKGEAVLIGIEEYARYEEYLRDKHVKKLLQEAETRAKSSDASWHSHGDFWNRVKRELQD